MVYTNKKCTWHDLIKKKNPACPHNSCRFAGFSHACPGYSSALFPFFLPFYETVLTLTSQPGLLLPAACSTLPTLFPSTQHCDACFAKTVPFPRANWRPLTQTETKRRSPSDKLTQWLMKPCMGERDARGCRWILTWNISWWYQYNRGSQSPHTQ